MYRLNKFCSERRLIGLFVALTFGMAVALLLLGHSAMGFSDPNHWIRRAVSLWEGDPELRRVLLFPFYVGLVLRLVGSSLVFLCNLPFLILLMGMCGWLTMRLASHRRELPRPWKALAFVCGAASLMIFEPGAMTRLLNPYRDGPGMALFLLAWFLFLRGDERKSPAWGFLAGLVCGLSLGIRETIALAYIPVGIWTVARVVQAPRVRRVWIWTGMMVLGGLLGLFPLFYQNHLYSGYFFIPAYSARLIVEEAEEPDVSVVDPLPADRVGEGVADGDGGEETVEEEPVAEPSMEKGWMTDRETRLRFHPARLIPGASPGYFKATSSRIVEKFWQAYRGVPGVFLLIALGVALIKRNPVVWGLWMPAFLITFLFYGSYHYVNWRYVFFLHVCLAPMVAAGLVEGLWGLGRFAPGRARQVGLLSLGGVAVLFSGWALLRASLLSDQRIYAWDIPKFRAAISPRLKEPRTFIGFYHHREMLAWFVDAGFNHSSIGSNLYRETLREEGLEAALRRSAAETREALDGNHLYLHDIRQMPVFLPLWTDVEPVVDLTDFPVTLYRYGRPLEKKLHEVVPWREKESSFQVSAPSNRDEPVALLFNPRRLWDFPDRERAELWLGDRQVASRVENGPQFVSLPGELDLSEPLTFTLKSDAPVTRRVPHRLWTRNRDLRLDFGLNSEWWFRSLLSEDLQRDAPMRGDALQFYDRAELTLPVFADADHDVFVEMRVEFYQDDALYRNRHMTLGTGEGDMAARWPLPPRRSNRTLVFPLGSGTGDLEFRELTLVSDVPAYDLQLDMAREGALESPAFVKTLYARVFSVPRHEGDEFEWQAGAGEDGARILGGMWSIENHLGRFPVRWTDGEGRLRLPSVENADQPFSLRVSYFPAPPKLAGVMPSVYLNGRELEEAGDGGEPNSETGRVTRTFLIPSGALSGDEASVLSIQCASWTPFEAVGAADHRQLGVMLHRVAFAPMDSEPSPPQD